MESPLGPKKEDSIQMVRCPKAEAFFHKHLEDNTLRVKHAMRELKKNFLDF